MTGDLRVECAARPLEKRLQQLLAVAVLLVVGAVSASIAPASKDFIAYWSAGQQLRRHDDPYSVAKVLALEKAQGYTGARPLMMRNPPWALFVAVPLGFVSARTGLALWLTALVLCMCGFLLLARVRARDWLTVCCFLPVLLDLLMGQSSLFSLLGLSGFLAWEAGQPVLAGVALLFLAFKPHIVFLLWPVLLVDTIVQRRWRMLAAAGLAVAVASVLVMHLDPLVWRHYLGMVHDEQIGNEFVPTLSFLLRRVVGPDAAWVQFLPFAAALLWVGWYYRRHRHGWCWAGHGLLLLFVSVLTSPYVWLPDEVVLLPAIAAVLAWPGRRPHTTILLLLLSALGGGLLLRDMPLQTGAYVWTAAAWLGWFVYSGGLQMVAKSAPLEKAR